MIAASSDPSSERRTITTGARYRQAHGAETPSTPHKRDGRNFRFAGLESMPVIVIDWRYVHQSTISRSSVRAKPTPTSDTCTGHEAEPNFTNYKYYCSSTVIQRAAFEKAKDLEADQPQGECCVRSNVAPIVACGSIVVVDFANADTGHVADSGIATRTNLGHASNSTSRLASIPSVTPDATLRHSGFNNGGQLSTAGKQYDDSGVEQTAIARDETIYNDTKTILHGPPTPRNQYGKDGHQRRGTNQGVVTTQSDTKKKDEEREEEKEMKEK
ncbi:hypothetical protein V8E53_001300 [Lactarius tabidus]